MGQMRRWVDGRAFGTSGVTDLAGSLPVARYGAGEGAR
jgi:hypothetical protein